MSYLKSIYTTAINDHSAPCLINIGTQSTRTTSAWFFVTGPTFYGQYLGTAEVTCICDLPRESDWGAPEAEMLVDVALCLALAICLHLLEFCLYLSGKNKSSLRAEVHYWLIYTSVHDYWSLQKSHSMTKIFQVIVVFMSVKRFVFWNDKSTVLKSCTFTTIQITWKCNKMSGIKIACKKKSIRKALLHFKKSKHLTFFLI